MKNTEARQEILLEASPKFLPALIAFQCAPNLLKQLWSSSILHLLGSLSLIILTFGGLTLVALVIADNTTAARSSLNRELRANARKARQEVGMWRTTVVVLSVLTPAALAQSLALGALTAWRGEPCPPLWAYAALGLLVGSYVSLLVGIYYGIGDLLAEPQTKESAEK